VLIEDHAAWTGHVARKKRDARQVGRNPKSRAFEHEPERLKNRDIVVYDGDFA
jgi:hypothetical protein